jgi:hypothetical protein
MNSPSLSTGSFLTLAIRPYRQQAVSIGLFHSGRAQSTSIISSFEDRAVGGFQAFATFPAISNAWRSNRVIRIYCNQKLLRQIEP